MFKIFFTLIFSTFLLHINVSYGRQVTDKNLEEKINKMWSNVNNMTNNNDQSKLEPLLEDNPLYEEQYKAAKRALEKLPKYFTEIENEARRTGKFPKLLYKDVFYEYLLKEFENSNLVPLIKQEANKYFSNEDARALVYVYIDKIQQWIQTYVQIALKVVRENNDEIYDEKENSPTHEADVFKYIRGDPDFKLFFNKITKQVERGLKKLADMGEIINVYKFSNKIISNILWFA